MSKISKSVLIIKEIGWVVGNLLKTQVDQAFGQLEQLQVKGINQAMLILAAVLLIIGGLGMIVYSIHIILAEIIPPAASGLILGLTLILSAIIVIFIAGNRSKR